MGPIFIVVLLLGCICDWAGFKGRAFADQQPRPSNRGCSPVAAGDSDGQDWNQGSIGCGQLGTVDNDQQVSGRIAESTSPQLTNEQWQGRERSVIHTRTHANAHTNMHTNTSKHIHAKRTRKHIQTHTCKYKHAQAHTIERPKSKHTNTLAHAHKHKQMQTNKKQNKHSQARTQAQTHNTCIYTRPIQSHKHAEHMHTHTHTNSRAKAHAQTSMQARTITE